MTTRATSLTTPQRLAREDVRCAKTQKLPPYSIAKFVDEYDLVSEGITKTSQQVHEYLTYLRVNSHKHSYNGVSKTVWSANSLKEFRTYLKIKGKTLPMSVQEFKVSTGVQYTETLIADYLNYLEENKEIHHYNHQGRIRFTAKSIVKYLNKDLTTNKQILKEKACQDT